MGTHISFGHGRLFTTNRRPKPNGRRPLSCGRRLVVEPLEDRRLLSVGLDPFAAQSSLQANEPRLVTLVSEGAALCYLVPTSAEAELGTAWTRLDYDDTNWTGFREASPQVLLSELGTRGVDFVEIQNVSAGAVQTGGWIVAVNDAVESKINTVAPVLWRLPAQMSSAQVLYRTDSTTDNYWGGDIFWRTAGPGWAMIVDDAGRAADFAVWGYSSAALATFDVTINGTRITAADLSWNGVPIINNGSGDFSLQRRGNADQNSAADWVLVAPQSKGQQNAGLSVPFASPGGQAALTTGIGFSDGQAEFDQLIRTDVGGEMRGVNASLWGRIGFRVDNPAWYSGLTLRMKYDDGFVAYLNGEEVARRNAPEVLTYDAAAAAEHPNDQAVVYEDIDVSGFLGDLRRGANVLAVHGLNLRAADSDFLLLPELVATAAAAGVAEVGGTVFDDRDRDRTRDAGEPGLPGWTVELQPEGNIDVPRLTLANPTPDEWSQFGRDVAAVGGNVLVGSHYDDVAGPPESGAAYLFDGSSGRLLHTFVSPTPAAVDRFGRAVAGVGDKVLIGAPWDDDAGAPNAGAAYLFDGDTGQLLRTFFSPNPRENDQFGRDVAAVGEKVLIGARLADVRTTGDGEVEDAGAAYLFDGASGELLQTFVSPMASRNGQFGYRVAALGDDVLVAARWDNVGAQDLGAVYLFDGTSGNLLQAFPNPTKRATEEPSDFGHSIAAVGGNVLVGARWDDSGTDYAGAAFLFDGASGRLLHTLTSPTPAAGEEFGFCVAALGDDALVGARWDNRLDGLGDDNGGAVYLFDGATGRLRQTIVNPRAGAWDSFGISVAALGQQVIVGAQTANAAYVFDVPTLSGVTVLTGAEGEYRFPGLEPGTYRIVQSVGEGYVQTFPGDSGRYTIGILGDEMISGLDFGNVRDEIPLASDDSFAVDEDSTLTIAAPGGLLVNDRDADGDPLAAVVVNQPPHGTLTLQPDGSFDYTPKPDFHGSDSFTYRAHDGVASSNLATVTISIRPINDPPVANDNGLWVAHNTAISVPAPGVLADDIDVDGNSLTAVLVEPTLHGTVVLRPDGSFTYTPEIDYVGDDSFAYKVNDGALDSNVAAVRLTVSINKDDSLPRFLRITELNYSPYPPTAEERAMGFENADAFEFIELRHVGNDPIDLVDLAGVRFTAGVHFGFITTTFLVSGQTALLVKDRSAFEARYGGGLNVVGEYQGDLNNNGERITLKDPFDQTVLDFGYSDRASWPRWTDGYGSTLEAVDPQGDYSDGANWRASSEYGGSPGSAGVGPLATVVINEVLSHENLPLTDAIELYNRTAEPIDISGWYLSESAGDFKKFRIPEGTVLPAGGYVVFDEYDFNPRRWHPPDRGFALSGTWGDDVWLTAADANGKLTHFVDYAEFDAALNGESFGRWPNGSGALYPMQSRTLGHENSGPRVGPVVISEVMYHPPDPDISIDLNDLEFIEVFNPTSGTVDLTNWRIRGGVEFNFPEYHGPAPVPAQLPGGLPHIKLGPDNTLVIVGFNPADNNLVGKFRDYYDIDDSVQIVGPFAGNLGDDSDKVRLMAADAPRPEEKHYWPPVLEDEVIYRDNGDWPAPADGEGDALRRVGANLWGNDAGSWIADKPTPGIADLVAPHLAVSEINYHPHDPTPAELAVNPGFVNDDFEFVELWNFGDRPVELGGMQFSDGITLQLAAGVLAPGARAVVARSAAAFRARYGSGITLAGQFTGRLQDDGERISLLSAAGGLLLSFRYDDDAPWPGRADGGGSSLELVDPRGGFSDGANWRASGGYGGSPGDAGVGPTRDVVVNEVLSRTNPPDKDALELFNPTQSDIDIGGWYLSDSSRNCTKFRIPAGTTIAAGGYLVFDEDDFNPNPQAPGPNDFSFDGVEGDDAVLVRPDPASGRLSFVDDVSFGAAAVSESFGRWPNGSGALYPLRRATLGAENGPPRVGPLIISEVMYHPREPDDVTAPNDLEFVEIHNPTAGSVDLTGWQIAGGIEFDFPAGAVLAPSATIVILPFDPADVNLWKKFCRFYQVSETLNVLGRYRGALSNRGDVVLLLRADAAPPGQPDVIPLLREDEVNYDDQAPWPVEADGYGEALHRFDAQRWGNDPASWIAARPTPGEATVTLYWDGRGPGQWDDIDPGSGRSRWVCAGGRAAAVYPNEALASAVVAADRVTVTADQSARDLTVQSGEIVVAANVALELAGELEIGAAARYTSELGHPANGLITVAGAAQLGGTLALTATRRSGGPLTWREESRTVIISTAGIQGAFAHLPPTGTHLGFGLFLTDKGPHKKAVTHTANAVVADVFRALAGDADGDRDIDVDDISRILAAAKFNSGQAADWTEGDFDGDGACDADDLQLVLATGRFNAGNYAQQAAGRGSLPASLGAATTRGIVRARDAVLSALSRRTPQNRVSTSAKLDWVFTLEPPAGPRGRGRR